MNKIVLIILAFLLPPIAVFMKKKQGKTSSSISFFGCYYSCRE